MRINNACTFYALKCIKYFINVSNICIAKLGEDEIFETSDHF